MTDQRDLAKEVEPFIQVLTEAAVEGVECTISNEMARSLSDFIASQSRELEELRNSIKAVVDGPPARMSSPLGFLPINSTGMRTLVDEVCKLQSELVALRDERNDWRKLADERSAEIVRLHRELRRPVVQSDEIAMALYELDAAVHASCIQDGDYSPVKVIRDALDQAQREIEDLKKKLKDQEQWSRTETGALKCQLRKQTEKRIELQREIARLSSPPEERRDIQERQQRRWDAISRAAFDNISHTVSAQDIDVLIQDLRRYENSHGIVMGERDAALKRVAFLEQLTDSIEKQLGISPDAEDTTIGTEIAKLKERIERLEGALRKIYAGAPAQEPPEGDASWLMEVAREALAAADGQQQKYIVQSVCPVCRGGAVGLNPLYQEPAATGDGVEGE